MVYSHDSPQRAEGVACWWRQSRPAPERRRELLEGRVRAGDGGSVVFVVM